MRTGAPLSQERTDALKISVSNSVIELADRQGGGLNLRVADQTGDQSRGVFVGDQPEPFEL